MRHLARRLFAGIAAASLFAFGNAATAAFPDEPIRLVVPYGGGGMGTAFASMVSELLSARLNAKVYAIYKPGANGTIGTDYVAKAAPDGYTLLMVTTSSLTINPVFLPNVHYDPLKDFAPISMVWMSRNVLFSNPAKVKSFTDLIAIGKERPLTFGSLGPGSLAHLSGEMLIRQAHLKPAIHVPFKGQGMVMTEVAGGRLDFAFGDPSGLQLATSGRVQALAVTGDTRLSTAPNVPTLAELGYPNVGTMSWIGIVAPAGTPRAIVDRISSALHDAFQDPAVIAKVRALGVEVAPDQSPDVFGKEIRTQLERWKKFKEETNITIQ